MGILRSVNSLWMNVLVAVMVLAFVIIMPLVDRSICKKLGISPSYGVGSNPNMEKLLSLRQLLLYGIFAVYMAGNFYLTFFSRSSGENYSIHFAPLQDLAEAIEFDSSFGSFLAAVLSGNFDIARSQISVLKPQDLAQAAMNVMFYIPMGYLLPYTFIWFRKSKTRVVVTCCLMSAVTENLQLITKRGCYDFDDLLFNTTGGLIGVFLYQIFAYSVTNPRWFVRMLRNIRFRRRAADTALFRFARGLDCGRVTMFASHEEEIRSFFVDTLGFRLISMKLPDAEGVSRLVLRLGGMCVEFQCTNRNTPIPPQTIMLSTTDLSRIRQRLEKCGVPVSNYMPDPYTQHRSMYILGPDNIRIIFGEY